MCTTCGCSDHPEFTLTDVGERRRRTCQRLNGVADGHTHHTGHEHPHEHPHGPAIRTTTTRTTMPMAIHMPMGTIIRTATRLPTTPRTGMRRAPRWRSNRRSWPRTTAPPLAIAGGFQRRGVLALNLVSSPGSGKTTLLERTLTELRGDWSISVIEGDQATLNDAERIRATGVPCGADQYRHRLPSGRRNGRPRARVACAAARLAVDDRERRQPRLPGAVRSWRAGAGGGAVGHRGRGQAAEVPAHVPRRGPAALEQDRPAALCAVRHRAPVSPVRAA